MLNLDNTLNKYQTDIDDVNKWADSEYNKYFFEHFKDVNRLHDKLKSNNDPVTDEELEWIYWNNATSARPSDNIETLLEYLYENNIKTGIVSNIMLSGKSLKRRIGETLPNNHFDFVIASSD